jgi:hypothetical protein
MRSVYFSLRPAQSLCPFSDTLPRLEHYPEAFEKTIDLKDGFNLMVVPRPIEDSS